MQPDPHAAAVAQRVRQALDERGMSHSELARRIDRTQSYISRRMTGEVSFSVVELVLIADVIGVPVAGLIADPAPLASAS